MKIERLFQVLVVTGASSTVGLVGCGSDDSGGASTAGTGGGTGSSGGSTSAGTGGATSSGTGGSTSAGAGGAAAGSGGKASGTGGGSSAACDAVCHPSTAKPNDWTDCNGCCCWLPVGKTTKTGSPICGEEPCCVGRGR